MVLVEDKEFEIKAEKGNQSMFIEHGKVFLLIRSTHDERFHGSFSMTKNEVLNLMKELQESITGL
jgi:hypothetical protein